MRKFIKKITWIYIRFVQKILITILLSLTYFLVIPFSWLFMVIFKPSQVFHSFKEKTSYWNKSQTLSLEIEEYKEQS